MTHTEWPSAEDIKRIHHERKRHAVAQAMRSPFLRDRLKGVDLERLDDPEVWAKIPLLTKEQLREISPERFHDEFCVEERAKVVEYWRSGGVTGRPMFYPRSALDMKYALLSFERAYPLIGAKESDCVHISFPLGIHPVASLFARGAEAVGIGTVWCGSGANTPSLMQLELIQSLKPTIWAGMASYGLHLANLAEANGVDLANSSVQKLIVAAEPLSPAKRKKLERVWGAEVFDHFGMTEAAWIAGESSQHKGLHVWSDLYFVEVVDEATGEPVSEGQVGHLVVTPLWNNNVTPFLRWVSGDLVSILPGGDGDRPWSVFPIMKHARRTIGFFKVGGININHNELEDLMFYDVNITDFKAEIYTSESGLDVLRLLIEPKHGSDKDALQRNISASVANAFQVTPEIGFLESGTLGKEFEATIKAARFVDRRG